MPTQVVIFNAHDNTEKWTTTPENMIDGSISTFASTAIDAAVQKLTANNNSGIDLGEIATVQARVHGYSAAPTTKEYYYSGSYTWASFNNPSNVVDGDENTYALAVLTSAYIIVEENTCPATNYGTITKVEIMAKVRASSGSCRALTLLTSADSYSASYDLEEYDDYVTVDITSDKSGGWSWSDVQGLDVRINCDDGDGIDLARLYHIIVKVTYTPAPKIKLRPVHGGSDGDDHEITLADAAAYSGYIDITSDTNMPQGWSWTDVSNLQMDVESSLVEGSVYVSCVELLVTYTYKTIRTPVDYTIELRNKDGCLKSFLHHLIQGEVSWEWNRIGGCGRCKIKINAEYRSIDFAAGDDVRIYVKSGSTGKLVYRGWVAYITPALKVPQQITLDVRGYFEKFKALIVHDDGAAKTYSNQQVSDIVDDIIDTYAVANSDITKGIIDGSSYEIDSLSFKCTVESALKTLADIHGKVEYGVDENLEFFWHNESDTLRKKFFCGAEVSLHERRIDWSELVNKIYFEGGTVDDVVLTKTAENTDSQDQYFLAEKIICNSSIITSSVADQYCSATLKEKAIPKMVIRGDVPNTDLRLEDTLPLGTIAFYDPDYDEGEYIVGESGDGGSDLTVGEITDGGSGVTIGGTYKGQVESIEYTLSNTQERFHLSITLGGGILETAAKIKQLEHMLNELRQR